MTENGYLIRGIEFFDIEGVNFLLPIYSQLSMTNWKKYLKKIQIFKKISAVLNIILKQRFTHFIITFKSHSTVIEALIFL